MKHITGILIKCKITPPSSLNRLLTNMSFSFEELGANPEKAKKAHNRPKNASEFAEKFYKGFYSLVDEEDVAEGKSHK
jgi:hypothetical protein